jgi:hypothetical protein
MSSQPWQLEFKRLWKELVPPFGQAKTVQGELIRAIGRLSEEAYRNGNINFDNDHAILCQYLRLKLKDPTVFSAKEIEQIDDWIDRVLKTNCPDTQGQGTCFSHLAEQVVRWCEAKGDLVPHRLNHALRR